MASISKEQIRALVGIYVGIISIMSILIPVPILAAIAQAFPDTPVILIQMLVSGSSFAAILGNFVVARLACYMYRRTAMLFSTALYLVGLLPLAFHDSIYPALVAAFFVGFAMGGIQNSSGAMITDYFEGDQRGIWFGLCSVFVGIGGVIYTMLAGMLGAQNWWMAYAAYLVIAVLLVIEFITLPKGNKEGAPEKGGHTKVPREVLFLSVAVFFYFACNQIFNNNIAMVVTGSGIGGVEESGAVTSFNTFAGIVGGLLVFPFHRIFKRQSLTVNAILSAIGCVLIFTASNIFPVFAGAFFMAFAYGVFNPLSSQYASEASDATGMAFNLAIVTSAGSLGNFFSPMMIGGVAGMFGGSAASSFMVGSVVCVVIAVVLAVYFAGHKAAKGESATSDAA